MPAIKPRATPHAEYVTFDGSNADEIMDLVRRVAALHVWSPLEHELVEPEVRDEPPHLGVNVKVRHTHQGFDDNHVWTTFADETVVARIEEGNALVFDPFATTPLFVVESHMLAAFYEET